MAVGGAAVVPQGRNLGTELRAVNHIGIAPSARGVERAIGGIVVDEVDIARGLVVDIGVLLYLAENLVIVGGYISNVGVGEGRTAAADAAPRGTTLVVDHDGVVACLAEIAEQRTAGNAASGNEDLDLLGGQLAPFGEDKSLAGVGVVGIAKGDIVGHGGARGYHARQLDAMGGKQLLDTRHTATAAAGTHAETRGVFQLVDGDIFAVANHL